MPVVGHALVGLATGLAVGPRAAGQPGPGPWREGLWLPATVVLAYVPDIAAQLVLLGGGPDVRPATHSIPFALALSVLLAVAVARLFSTSPGRALAITSFSILTHDVLDLAQATDRTPWWPFSTRPIGGDLGVIPAEPQAEAILFSALFAVFLLARYAFVRPKRRTRGAPVATPARWLGRALTLIVLLGAIITHQFRDLRERQLDEARRFLDEGRSARALELLTEAERWPAAARPGRILHLRGEVYLQLGDRGRAERHYLEAYAADPGYFWIVADLALLYAHHPSVEQRRFAAPYLAQLRRDFADHPDLPAILRRVERALAAPNGRAER